MALYVPPETVRTADKPFCCASEIFAVSNVDGALVGGASLKAADFSGIVAALEAA